MSRLAEFRKLEQQLAAQLAELETLKNDDGLKKEIEFETKLRDLLAQYGCSLKDVINILDPQAATRKGAPVVAEKVARRARTVKVYKNPHNGEIVETKGGNHKTLKAWKAEHGSDEVESWLAH
ncbi:MULTISPECIES: histone-like nucleoid-structuring protein, MvaT/MvaU family [unclassified Pseudomonas]|uniref:histone-like nucleoid-structuring protein, MvaT/MvaU family n=1 Tax=unclassified Pseudomonas TaxID=196821 RepID=UPI000D38D564|nr:MULTISPECIES: histone-like nucleoid-structuring protein, MvaT/MvaU family [unclassified Pseudomonas]RAU47916.1 transcriptional regulator [Pseudomonas sp. RIT 409]RAU55390.1 transcriptional regulator [Pseudomonas sp. RIT 412]